MNYRPNEALRGAVDLLRGCEAADGQAERTAADFWRNSHGAQHRGEFYFTFVTGRAGGSRDFRYFRQ